MKLALSFHSSCARRAPAFFSALFLASATGSFLGCDGASVDASNSPAPGSAGASAGDAGADGNDPEPVPDVIAFEPASTLKLRPKQTRQLTVQTTPPGVFRMRFALLDSGSDSAPLDAVLDTGEIMTDDSGVGHVTLTAPSMPTTFMVRASVGRAQARIGVSVSALGYTRLLVTPSYSGQRDVTSWTATATARAGKTCSKLLGTPPPDGDLTATVPAKAPLYLDQVPVGVDLAITLRAGHYIGGCIDQSALSEGDGNQVLVYASDRPLNLDDTALDLSFGPSDSLPDFDRLMKADAALVEAALLGDAKSDVEALLNEMRDATSAANRDAFSAARTQNGWQSALETAFGKGSARRLRDPVERWLDAGLASLDVPNAFSGQLTSLGAGSLFELHTVVQSSPTNAGFPSSFQASWSADSSDTLLLGSDLSWVPSRLVTALATAPALLEIPAASTVEAALAQVVDCALVGKVLIVYGASPGSAVYASCDEACAVGTCVSAVDAAWKKARTASGTKTATLSVTATGMAHVGDAAEVTDLTGSWVGKLVIGAESAPASGLLAAASSAR